MAHIINCGGNGGWLGTTMKKWHMSRLLRSWGEHPRNLLILLNESLEKKFGVELNGIEYDAKFIFEYIRISTGTI